MKISTKGRYSLRAMIDLASILKKGRKSVSLREIAKRQNISSKYLENLFNTLKSAGILKSVRGPRGGYYFSRPPSRITVLEVLQAIEGPLAIVECCISDDFCDKIRTCKTYRLWKRVNNKILAEFGNTSLSGLI